MSTLNKVILIGNLGANPEVRQTTNGKPVANFSVATNEFRTNEDGEHEEKTEWHRVVVFGQMAEVYGKMLNKGDRIFVDGRLQTRNWTDNSGQERRVWEVIAWQIRNLSTSKAQPGKLAAAKA